MTNQIINISEKGEGNLLTIFEPLCKCNKCDTVYIDLNPSTEQPKLPILDGEYDTLIPGKDGEFIYYACPCCETDDFLVDILTEEQIND